MFSNSYAVDGRRYSVKNTCETWVSRPVPSRFGHAVAIAIFLVGCGEPKADWYGDTRFTADERAEVEAGAAWLAAASGHKPISISWTYEVGTQAMPHTIRRERPIVDGPTGYCSDTNGDGTLYLDAASTNRLAGLTAHEMGHCVLGLKDDMQSDGIMHILEPRRWTDREEAQCETRRCREVVVQNRMQATK